MDKFYKRPSKIWFLIKIKYVFIGIISLITIFIPGCTDKRANLINGNWWAFEDYGLNDTSIIYGETYFVDDSVVISYDAAVGLTMSLYRVNGDTIFIYNIKNDYANKFYIERATPDLLVLESVYNYTLTLHKIKQNIDVSRLISKNETLEEGFIKEFFIRRDSIIKQCKK